MMQWDFDPHLEYQQKAIKAVADLFDGQKSLGQQHFDIKGNLDFASQGLGLANNILLTDDQLLKNTRRIQEKNNIPQIDTLQGRHFSIEMETGTGKTYVYLRTIFELNKQYGFKKFIIVVPSVAIREGVIKSIEIIKKHLRDQYNQMPFDYFLYDSKQLHKVRNFRNDHYISIMVMNIQAFQKDIPHEVEGTKNRHTNIIYLDNDRMGGRPIEFIQSTHPIVIIDEPQSVDSTPKSQKAIEQLNPALTLRYSATHKNPYNLLYKLGPIEAFEQNLVKKIEIASIHKDEDYVTGYVKYLKGKPGKRARDIQANLEIYKKTAKGLKKEQIWVRQYDDLYKKSNKHFIYRHGFEVVGIDVHFAITLSNGHEVLLQKSLGGSPHQQDLMKIMIKETIKQHFKKELAFKNQGIKVLSLFFVDKVADYRIYNKTDGTTSLGPVGQWFEEYYNEFAQKNPDLIPFKAEEVHGGYFSKDKKSKIIKDTKGNTKDDGDTYALIMRDKERLLDLNEPLRFIFSHSTLKEGWDNPNVFQICTLRDVYSEMERRQQIGRGLRLPVNQKGRRIRYDGDTHRLTVIASEGYKEYAVALQREYAEATGITFGKIEKHAFSQITEDIKGQQVPIGETRSRLLWDELKRCGYINAVGEIQEPFDPEREGFVLEIHSVYKCFSDQIMATMKQYLLRGERVVNAHKRRKIQFHKEVYLREDFRQLWERINQKTFYQVFFDTKKLTEKAIYRIKNMEGIPALKIASTRAALDMTRAGIQATQTDRSATNKTITPSRLPNVMAYLYKKTQMSRRILFDILYQSNRWEDFLKNPYPFMEAIVVQIAYAKRDLIRQGLQYTKIRDGFYKMEQIEEDAQKGIIHYMKNLYSLKHKDKSLYDSIPFDSKIEEKFARDLDNHEYVKLFVKLPLWFKIKTPFGPYNPDWAFVTEREEKLYFIRETKDTTATEELRPQEKGKMDCGRKHFEKINANFDVVTSLDEVSF